MKLRWQVRTLWLLAGAAAAIGAVTIGRGSSAPVLAAAAAAMFVVIAITVLERRVFGPLARLRSAAGNEAGGASREDIATLANRLDECERELAAARDDLARREADRVQAVADQRLAEERLALAVRSANDGLWEWDLGTGAMLLSPRWKAMLGYGEHELGDSRNDWRRCVHADDLPVVDALVAGHLEGRTVRYELQHRVRHRDGGIRWVLSRGAAIRHASGRPYRMIGLDTDVTSVKRVEIMLQEIAEGTAGDSGEAFFRSLVRHFARALRVPCAFVTECVDHPPTRLRTLAFWSDEGFLDNFEYQLTGTPCEAVVNGAATCFHPRGVGVAFPAEAGYEGYIGVPIIGDDRRVLGHLAFLDRKPIGDDAMVDTVFRIFTARAAAELARMHTQALVLRIVDSLSGMGGDQCFAALVRSFAELMGVREAIVTECFEAPQKRVRVLAWWREGRLEPSVEYDLAGSTCEETIEQGRVCFYPQGVGERFPPARPFGRESYLGVPCLDTAGRVLGHVACFDDRPMLRALPDHAVLRLYAERAAVEIERRRLLPLAGATLQGSA